MEHTIKEVVKEVLGQSKGSITPSKDTSWRNEDVRCVTLRATGSKEGRKRSYSKGESGRLNTKEGEKDIYRLARIRDTKTRDIERIKCEG